MVTTKSTTLERLEELRLSAWDAEICCAEIHSPREDEFRAQRIAYEKAIKIVKQAQVELAMIEREEKEAA